MACIFPPFRYNDPTKKGKRGIKRMERNRKKFVELVKQEVEKKTGCEVITEEITKEKEVLYSFTVQKKGEPSLPLVSFDCFYEAYQKGRSMEHIVETILYFSENQKALKEIGACFSDYQKAKYKICYKLVNREKHLGFLKEMPHEPFLDLVKLYYVIAEEKEGWKASVAIQNSQLKAWGISEEALKQQAEENMKRIFPVQAKSILEAIQEFMETGEKIQEEIEIEHFPNLLFVFSNAWNCYGASVIAYDGLLKKIAEKWNGNVVILPSSVHEVILTPIQEEVELLDLVEIVKEINATEVKEEEVLSNHVYLYEKESGNLVVI